MLSDKLQSKLKAMGQGRPCEPVRIADTLDRAAGPSDQVPSRPVVRTLETLVPGQVVECDLGTCYLIERDLEEFWPDAEGFVRRYLDLVRGGRARVAPRADADLLALARRPATGALYFDIETCGFAGTPLFLIGTMCVRDDRLVFHQFLARDYGEEAAALLQFAERLAGVHTLVSFNGKSFDWPFVTDRAALHRIPLRPLPHVDLLHQARRSWRTIVPDHKLQTLEFFLCNRRRTGDIPGSAIPAAYHDFVRTGHATQIRDILRHNLLDLVTMAELVTFLLADEFPVR